MSRYLAKSASVLLGLQTTHGTPETLTGDEALAVVDLEWTDEFATKDYTFAGKPTREVNTYVTDKTSSSSFTTYFPTYGTVTPALYKLLEASGAATVLASSPLVTATNSLESCDEATLQVLQHQHCSAGNEKSQVMQDAGAMVDLEMELDSLATLKFSWQGEYAIPTDVTPVVLDFGDQKNFIAPAVTRANITTAKLQPLEDADVGDINICFSKLSVTNVFGQKLDRYRLGCDSGHTRVDEAGEVKLSILEDSASADYLPDSMLEKLHSLTIEWGLTAKQGITFDNLQLTTFSKVELGVWSGYELTFKNKGSSDLYNTTAALIGITPIDNVHWETGYVGEVYSATFTATGGSGTAVWSATGLPTDLSLHADTGVLSGTIQAGEEGTTEEVQITVTKGTEVFDFNPFDYVITTESQYPVAVDDVAEVTRDSTSQIDVLSNDLDGLGTATLESIVSVVGEGSASVNAGQIEFISGSNAGTTTVTYQMSDGLGNYSEADLVITITDAITVIGWRLDGLRNNSRIQYVEFTDSTGPIPHGVVFGINYQGGETNIFTDDTNVGQANGIATVGKVFTAGRDVNEYTVRCDNLTGDSPPDAWNFQYSDDTTDGTDGTWTTIDAQSGLTWTSEGETKTFNGFND